MDGVGEVADVYSPHSYADHRYDFGELFAEFIELLAQGSLDVAGIRDAGVDFTWDTCCYMEITYCGDYTCVVCDQMSA